jgi:hypothetical protein
MAAGTAGPEARRRIDTGDRHGRQFLPALSEVPATQAPLFTAPALTQPAPG